MGAAQWFMHSLGMQAGNVQFPPVPGRTGLWVTGDDPNCQVEHLSPSI